MFFSLPKILALVAVIGAVWYGFRLLEAHRKSSSDIENDPEKDGEKQRGSLDLEECSSCGAWVVNPESCPYCR
ncbi:MAG: Uncharacterised protein [SAR116 cluster bacterium]|nr:MAG: Uncharacterised protein [SAR116 cluster bacterium]